MKYFKNFLLFSFALFALTTLVTPAYALSISPGDEILSGPETGVPKIEATIIAAGYSIGTELYKDDVGGVESGAFAGSYSTTYNLDFSEVTIEWTGGDFISDNPFLLVKDGNQNPAWYLFDLGTLALDWTGMEDLVLTDFWPGNGAISHVALYGGSTPVPEPATMLLFGLGLLGIAGLGRKTNKN